MKAISIRQPWAWMIIHAGKDIENRDWYAGYRGRVLVHAAKGVTRDEWEDAWTFAHGSGASPKAVEGGITLQSIERGGVIGSVEIVDCVQSHSSRWFMGRYGFVLRNPIALPFRPFKGMLGFFDVPDLPEASNPELPRPAVAEPRTTTEPVAGSASSELMGGSFEHGAKP